MGKVAILTDSNSGITQAQSKEMGVTVIPMPFFIDGEQYFEDINLTQEEFYKKLQEDADISTSQPSVGELQEYFESKDWYVPKYSPKQWDKKGDTFFFNKYEIKNRDLLKKYENK